MTIKKALEKATNILKNITDRARLEAEILLAFALNKERIYLHINENKDISPELFFLYIKRRENFEPIEYITGKVSFYSETFFTQKDVLIARPETEILIDKSIELIKKNNIEKVIEIGVGSGIVSIMLAKIFPNLKITATDINSKALNLTEKNAKYHNVNSQIELIKTSYMSNIEKKFDFLVSNPPYISNNYKIPNSVEYEPKNALFGGNDGHEMIFKIIDLVKKRDIPYLAIEMGYDQKKIIESYLVKNNFYNYEFYKDLAKLDRGFVIKK